MEDGKPTYKQIEQELNEYKELLWQLSDEYKVNLGTAEKKVEEEKAKIKVLESKIETEKEKPENLEENIETIDEQAPSDFLKHLGLPACVLDNEGKIVKHNNKFKFLVELIGYEIEEVENISDLFKKNKEEGLQEKFVKYTKSDDGVLQSLFKVENQFQSLISLVIRVYRNTEENQHLALFVELSANEIKSLGTEKESIFLEKSELTVKKIDQQTEILGELRTEIAIFTEKYELLEEISKIWRI